MNKVVVGLVLGLVLGAIDGASAWFYPEVRSMMASIMVGSSIKGLVVGVLTGWFAKKVHSLGWGIAAGALIGLVFAFLVAAMGDPNGQHHYMEIMMPGFVVGAIIGFVTQRVGNRPAAQNARARI
jgi:F0F1-type ATP synthase assembly protein I